MKKLCISCKSNFDISSKEISYLKKVSPLINEKVFDLPLPNLCPGCREQNRVSFRNEFNFYKRKCDFSGKELIAIYDNKTPYIVYDPNIWWSDDYDPLEYGRDFDFSKTFFEQFDSLNLVVPKAAIQNAKSENSQYTNYSSENKNCYMCAGSSFNEDVYYCSRVISSKLVCDSYDLLKSENCYGCVHSTFLYNCAFSKNCHNSSNLILCNNCIGCSNCIACNDLQNQKYSIFNISYTKEEYKTKSKLVIEQLKNNGFSFDVKSTRDSYIVGSENCSGNQLFNSQNCTTCFSLKECRDCMHVGLATNSNDCFDCNFMDRCELVYNSTNLISNYHVMFAALVWYTSESSYVMNCYHSKYLFGCTGMKKHEYCILNKKYSKTDYFNLVEKIIKHMQETKEWGMYFPMILSPFPYNVSVAYDYYPMSEEQAEKRNLKWQSDQDSNQKITQSQDLNKCSVTGKIFRIIKQEKDLCELLGINFPTKCPEVRRLEMTSPLKRAISNY